MRLHNKFFVLNDDTDLYWLSFIRINDDNTGIYARINPIPFQIEKSFDAINRHSHRYIHSEKSIFQLVQIHTNKYTKLEDSEVFIPFNSISSIKIYEKDWLRTVTLNAISFIAVSGFALYWIITWRNWKNWGQGTY